MQNMTLENIAACLQCALYQAEGREQTTIKGAVLDSRKVEPGFAFFAVKGERVDGHSFIPQVARMGAALVICQEKPVVDIPYILVEDTLEALKKVAAFYRETLHIPLVGVTGSVGKTSTKEMIAAVLGEKFNVLKTQGNFNNEIGLPLTILSIRGEHEAAVVEMGISDFGEMHRLSQIAKPDICVITNIGQCHLENLIDRDGVLRAKIEIFDFLAKDGYAILNGDDDKLATVGAVNGRKPYFFGLDSQNDSSMKETNVVKEIFAEEIQNQGLFGSVFKMNLMGEWLEAKVPLPGRHMVINALAAACVGRILGMDSTSILEGIASVQATGGRSNIMKLKEKTIIDDCYNANPVSMKSAVDLLKMANGPKCVILGDMFELGENEFILHQEVGQYAAQAALERMIFIGDLAKEMYEGAKSLGALAEYYPDKMAFFMVHEPKDFTDMTVLVKASHGMHFEEIVEWMQK